MRSSLRRPWSQRGRVFCPLPRHGLLRTPPGAPVRGPEVSLAQASSLPTPGRTRVLPAPLCSMPRCDHLSPRLTVAAQSRDWHGGRACAGRWDAGGQALTSASARPTAQPVLRRAADRVPGVADDGRGEQEPPRAAAHRPAGEPQPGPAGRPRPAPPGTAHPGTCVAVRLGPAATAA